ncbi:MAG TPA: hypothetical protein VJI96_04770 [Candidatus Andersenbacteria bacterium]|nr:hypothetical protein [Candidatus Andersenbacteria bacterium]
MSGGMMCAWLGTKSMPIAQSIACILLVICGIFFFGFVIVMTIVIIPRVLDILDLHELRYQFHCLKTSFRKWMWDWRYETVDMCVSYTLIGMTIASCGFVFFDVAITVIPPQLKS